MPMGQIWSVELYNLACQSWTTPKRCMGHALALVPCTAYYSWSQSGAHYMQCAELDPALWVMYSAQGAGPGSTLLASGLVQIGLTDQPCVLDPVHKASPGWVLHVSHASSMLQRWMGVGVHHI